MYELSRQELRALYIANFIDSYLDHLNASLLSTHPHLSLTRCQKVWLGYCLSGILHCNKIDWLSFSKSGLQAYELGALSYMFRNSPLDWSALLVESSLLILKSYGIKEGVLVIDDSNLARSKSAQSLYKLGRFKDKATGGYINGQCLVFLVLVTDKVTIPIGFRFYEYDPIYAAWVRENKRLRKKQVKKPFRPKAPSKQQEKYPSKIDLGIALIEEFKSHFPDFEVKGIVADCLYGTAHWVESLSKIYPNAQLMSQLRNNQTIGLDNQKQSLQAYFEQKALVGQSFSIRGKEKKIYYHASIIRVKAHQNQKRLVIAYKFDAAAKLRYLFATNMTWQVTDLIRLYSVRWLVEVFIQDWKQYEGFGQLAKQTGEDGSRKAVTLSLLFDHCLILHPHNQVRVKDQLPLCTIGSLRNRARNEWLIELVEKVLNAPNAQQLWKLLASHMKRAHPLKDSKKHFSGNDFVLGKVA